MPLMGPRAAVDLALPAGIDGSRILQFNLRDGITGQQAIERAAVAIGTRNEQLLARYGRILYFTQDQYAYYMANAGGRSMTPRKAEFKRADGVRGANAGHMLPLWDYEDALEWTRLYLRDAWLAQVDADIRLIADRWENRFVFDLFTRMLSTAENAISGGYDVPWAIGTGTNVNFIPPQYGSFPAFDSTHTHFKYYNGTVAAKAAQALKESAADLRHHGHTGRLVSIVNETDAESIAALTGFVKFVPSDVQVVAGGTSAPTYVATRELDGIPGELIGFYLIPGGQVVEIWINEYMPTEYLFITKSYGSNNPKNGIAIREHPAEGFGMRPDPRLTTSINPELDFVLFMETHGTGVNDRLNGVAIQIRNGAGSYSSPSLT